MCLFHFFQKPNPQLAFILSIKPIEVQLKFLFPLKLNSIVSSPRPRNEEGFAHCQSKGKNATASTKATFGSLNS